jgi:hypothetical protein
MDPILAIKFQSAREPPSLPITPAHTPQGSDMPARSENNGPVRPHSQDERSPVGQRSPGIDPLTRSWVLSGPGKKAFYNSYSLLQVPLTHYSEDGPIWIFWYVNNGRWILVAQFQ